MSLQSLNIGANCITHELDIRTLAALSALRHLAVAGNPVMADMDPREQRVFVMDLMPGENSSWALCVVGVVGEGGVTVRDVRGGGVGRC